METPNTPAEQQKAGGLMAAGAHKRGLETQIEREDLIIPRAKLLQSKSPEVEEDTYRHLNLRPGQIINSLTREVMPEVFIPVLRFVNWIRFNPRQATDPNFDAAFDPGAIIYMTSDPHDPRLDADGMNFNQGWGPNGEKPKVTKFINFLSYFPGVEMPMIISFAKTSYKTGKELSSLVRFMPGDVFSRQYKLGSRLVKNDVGSFYVFTVVGVGQAPKDQFDVSEAIYTEMSVKAENIKVHDQAEVGAEEFTE